MSNEWLKGGLRYAKLSQIVRERCAPEPVDAFFVATRNRRRLDLFNPFSPLRREYVVGVTNEKVFVLKLKRPGVFRAAIAKVIYEKPRRDARARWQRDRFILNEEVYWPIAFHGEDAEQVASLILA
jgi:hypothetical protein